MLGTLVQNANVCIVQQLGNPKATKLLAKHLGRAQPRPASGGNGRPTTETGAAVVGSGASAGPLRDLAVGEAVITVNRPTSRVEWVSIAMREPRV
jgi:hypothetical protein